MPVTIEQNIGYKKAVRNDLRVIPPAPRERWFYNRGPVKVKAGGGGGGGEPETYVPPTPSGPAVEELVQYAKIDFATAITKEIIGAAVGRGIRIYAIVLIVGGETNLTLYDGAWAISGAMDFGASGEPRGIVIEENDKPLMLNLGNAFKIASSAAVQVSGFVKYSYAESTPYIPPSPPPSPSPYIPPVPSSYVSPAPSPSPSPYTPETSPIRIPTPIGMWSGVIAPIGKIVAFPTYT